MRWKLALVTALVVATAAVIAGALVVGWASRGNAPGPNPCGFCGTAFALSPATEQGHPGQWWYNFSFQSASGGMTLGDLVLQVQGPYGSNIPLANATVTVVGVHGGLVGVYSTATTEWTMGGSELVSNQQTLVIECSNDLRYQGDVLVVLGERGVGWTGSVTVNIP